MSDLKDMSKELPDTKSSFTLEVEGASTRQTYRGKFECKILNRKDRANIVKHRAFLNGPLENQLDVETLSFHHMVAYLRFALTQYPSWWKEADLGYELYDGNVVLEVYQKVMEFEEEWMKEVWGEDKIKELKNERDDEAEAS